MYVIPTPGLQIPDPAMRGTPAWILPPEGREVQADDYWHRRVRDGDVVERVDAPADGVVKTPVDGNELSA